METQRSTTLARLIADAESEVENLAAWPESEATRTAATNVIKNLRKAFKEDSYPRFFLLMTMAHLAHELVNVPAMRDVKLAGLRAAWAKIGELLGEDK